MQIRLASLKDTESIMCLVKKCIKDMEAHGIFQWNEYYPTKAIFKKDIKSGSLYILEDTGNFLGIITINENQSPEYKEINWLDKVGRVLVIHRLAVNPERQSQGIGRQLMNFAENFAAEKSYGSIRLDTYSQNLKALNFYEYLGYKKVGQVFFTGRELPFYCYEKVVEK